MAKEIFPADPIPVGDAIDIEDSVFCGSFINYSKGSYTDTVLDLINYLESEFPFSGFRGTTQSYITDKYTVEEVEDMILLQNIHGLSNTNLYKYVTVMEMCDEVIIMVNLY